MSDRERPGGREPSSAGARPGEVPTLRLYRSSSRRASAGTPDSVAERLAALERQVEEALARSAPAGGADGATVLRSWVDAALVAAAGAGRLSFRDAVAEGVAALERTLAGVAPGSVPLLASALGALYDYWWRVETVGLERVPADGPVVVVANRGPALLPYEALAVAHALAARDPAPLRARPALDVRLMRLPVVGRALAGLGAVRDTRAAVGDVLADGEAVIVLPEGARAEAKTIRQRYRLAGFGRGTFAHAALAAGATIVPVAVIGIEEADAVLARVTLPGAPFGLTSLPVTPTFPWLGAAGLLPLPTKWTIHVGEPLDLAAAQPPSSALDPDAVARLRDDVRERLQALVQEALRRRDSVFLG